MRLKRNIAKQHIRPAGLNVYLVCDFVLFVCWGVKAHPGPSLRPCPSRLLVWINAWDKSRLVRQTAWVSSQLFKDSLLQNKLRRFLLKWFFLTQSLCFVVGSYVKSFTVWIWIRREQNFIFRCIKYVFQIDSSQLPQSIDNISIQNLSIQGSVHWVNMKFERFKLEIRIRNNYPT